MAGIEVWTERYRPKKLGDVINQKHVVARLKAWIRQGNIPNILLAGPAGVGKTTIALCLAKELYGESWRQNFQETNASDERGINIVRGRIKDFAKMKPLGADFKIIFLDESDSLTPEAQQALRRTIESFSGVCRFILSCNYSSRIIEPIQSRCAVFRLRGLNEEDVKEYLNRVVDGEKLDADADGLKAIYDISNGDLRKSTNLLQASSALGKITSKSVYEIAAHANPKDVRGMIDLALSGKFTEARKKLMDLLINQGLSGEDIIKEMHKQVLDSSIPETDKLNLVEKIGEFEFRMNQGGSEDIQLQALLTHFLRAGK